MVNFEQKIVEMLSDVAGHDYQMDELTGEVYYMDGEYRVVCTFEEFVEYAYDKWLIANQKRVK